MKKFKCTIKRAGQWFLFALTGGGDIAKEAVQAGICDFSGQGRTNP